MLLLLLLLIYGAFPGSVVRNLVLNAEMDWEDPWSVEWLPTSSEALPGNLWIQKASEVGPWASRVEHD